MPHPKSESRRESPGIERHDSTIFTGLPPPWGTPSYKFGFRSSVQENGLPGEERHEGLVLRNDVLTNGFIGCSLARTLARIFFVPRLRPPSPPRNPEGVANLKKAICVVRRDSIIRVTLKFFYCSSLSQLMILALGSSQKCSRCIQTHTPFTVGSH